MHMGVCMMLLIGGFVLYLIIRKMQQFLKVQSYVNQPIAPRILRVLRPQNRLFTDLQLFLEMLFTKHKTNLQLDTQQRCVALSRVS